MDEDLKHLLKTISIIAIITLIVLTIVIWIDYYSCCREVKIFNAKYETEYTCGDFFWAKDQINQQIQTIKIEGIE